ncbi:MAG TPA: bifunctional phosphoribosylaminoimidazolecarboxamide formyltransferase/IMP cyclohydrolase [Stackebrandtia sp.]|jgi:phosphoribosylaminoimidazolecarboxamide formyltransferase/IMP cyclohydrolase|uniref:bifunctional phosphoribosylaminoimidazolecarboxamide formyltransferase/IMP cyclohydrolase n=1 Tax=Stackebrandtia sp. TaxID=2023065 RepID=UPI002D2F1BCA|nr:bifunctional phosphoribosylaminoimidazolecarboxamide formyltransferase/IMP cyclohydrolase [Stackebrandtia sp.]HZE38569.1 bifunctional phosphoribosylaminoimidazolecarboxamide formyltransferase/IMP cyclohydrolase [Stackebrandtia sp.]
MTSASDARKPIRRALIGVYDKNGLDRLALGLHEAGVELVSTGGTAAAIADLGVPVTRVEDLTGFPEALDGRVKTLHPKVHAGLLADLRKESHAAQLAEFGIAPFDLLVVNLYPFAETLASGAGFDETIEQIDVGGPSMVRGAAKNHANVAVVVEPGDYAEVLGAVDKGGFTEPERRVLAAKAFAHLATYDSQVATWLNLSTSDGFPPFVGTPLHKVADLRYGENPHQGAALYADPRSSDGLAQAEQLHGKPMSYNNYVDTDGAWRACNDFGHPCVAIIKHTNPCGIATASNVAEAYRKAHVCDPVSAYGGVIAANTEVNVEMARQVAEVFTEVIVAPSFHPEALKVLQGKKNIRILRAPQWVAEPVEYRAISGGALGQIPDRVNGPGDDPDNWKLVTGAALDPEALADAAFAWWAVRAVKSNAILLASNLATVGVGMGQVNRVDSARLAVNRAGERARGAMAASDAFFPFADGLKILATAGVRAVVQPGGSIRDDEVIAAAAEANLTMYFTGTRHFFH